MKLFREVGQVKFSYVLAVYNFKLNVIADFQMAGDFTHPQNHIWTEHRIGDRYKEILPVKKILDSGAHVTLSSDWDVSSLNPLVGISNVVKFGHMNLKQALKAYTIKGAYALRQEKITGTLELGKVADLIILNKNLFNISADELKSAVVIRTILDGKTVYAKK